MTLGRELPVLVELERDGVVESRHRGSVVALDGDGSARLALGETTAPILPRSSAKPLQACAMLRAGLDLDREQLALACASHSGEPRHLELVRAIVSDHGLTVDALRNTPEPALGAQGRLVHHGQVDRLHANCSGKHAAMVATCVTRGWPLESYLSRSHPLQVHIRANLEELAGEPLADAYTDGCGAPLYGLSLAGLARGFAALARAEEGSAERRVADAMRAHPWAVGGSGREVTRLLAGVPGLVCKDGAEGVFAAAMPDGRAVAVKIEDGDGRLRAAPRVLVAALRALGVEAEVLDELATAPVTGGGRTVGHARAVLPAVPSRVEQDLLGSREVPADAYYGIHALRAVENFRITGTAISAYPDLIVGLACVKQAAAMANRDLGLLEDAKADAIVKACEEIRAGRFHDQFVVDVIQGGAGTSTNMNANEVIANRALEHLGHRRGDYRHLLPLEDVNRSQSTNDVYPTAVNVALHMAAQRLLGAMDALRAAFEAKAEEFDDVVKLGRTQLQDAVPMTLGQELSAYAVMLGEDQQRLAEACSLIQEVCLGGTAIGTGLNAHPRYPELAREHLARITGIPVVTSPNLVEATQDAGAFVQLSGVLKRIAVKLSKTCNDLRLLSSGPRAGFGEINLPPVQAGSSIMPGKVNPVIPEVVNQIAFEVIGNDVTVSLAAEGGQLQLNAFEPIVTHSLFESLLHLRAGCVVLAERCVTGITANRRHLRELVEHSVGVVTALNPHIGYSECTAIAREALATGQSVYELVRDKGLIDERQLEDILRTERLAAPVSADASPETSAPPVSADASPGTSGSRHGPSHAA